MIERSSGVLMHISSLPSKYGIGTFGKKSYEFIDFLKKSEQKFWQILPLCPTDETGSAYQSFSTFAGNFCFIDLDILKEKGILKEQDYAMLNWGINDDKVDFEKVVVNRLKVLKKAYLNFRGNLSEKVIEFTNKNSWVKDYANFMVLSGKHGGRPFFEWEDIYKNRERNAMKLFERENEDEINFWIFLQIEFFEQWNKLKMYANESGIEIIGDLPIYVSLNSADVWKNPENFSLNSDKTAKKVSGCPPDAFAKDGQFWGHPVYDWDVMKSTGFLWWKERLKQYTNMFSYVRIDHFRGFDSYYEIDAKEETARNGVWKKGPGLLFFKEIEKELGNLKLIAEDLGFLTDSVRQLLKDVGYPGMQILQHSFDYIHKDLKNLPEGYEENRVLYIGTHDNDTAIGWFKGLREELKENLKQYFGFKDEEEINWKLIEAVMETRCSLCILQMQDLIGLDERGRMNTPSTVGNNWMWRMKKEEDLEYISERLKEISTKTNRLHK